MQNCAIMAKCLKIHTFALIGLQYFLLTYLSTECWMPLLKQPYEQGALRFLVEHTYTACLVHQNCF